MQSWTVPLRMQLMKTDPRSDESSQCVQRPSQMGQRDGSFPLQLGIKQYRGTDSDEQKGR
jgi:hypothetical protein